MSSGGIVDGTLLDLTGAVWPPGAERLYQDLTKLCVVTGGS